MTSKLNMYRAALYMRLSKDDEGTQESPSITNQRNMLAAYAIEHGFTVIAEYVDDGFSGTNFDRPAFKQMIQDIENEKINLILTKDLSRLGRDYIQTGQYTEVYFPSKKVRYIAVNDGFDSDSPYTDIAPFKHIVNEMYARDTSKKIRSAFAAKMRSGCYIGNFAPYGYRKDPANKSRLLPDEISAAVVKEIFLLAAEGVTPAGIARNLNERNLLSPALYRCSLHPQLSADSCSQHKLWTAAAVSRLLRSIVYLGHLAQGKSTKVSFKSKVTLRNEQKNWIVVENTHEPLVSDELFQMAQKRLQSRVCVKEGQFCNIFSGLAKCADCGRSMSAVGTRKKGSPASLACGGYKLYGSGECSNHFIDYNALYNIVLETIREQVNLTEAEQNALYGELCAQLCAQAESGSCKSEQNRLTCESKKLIRIMEQLYDDYLNERIEKELLEQLLHKYRGQIEQVSAKIEGLELAADKEAKETQQQESFDQLSKLINQYTGMAELTPNLLYQLIDRIEIGQGQYKKTGHGKVKHQQVTIHFRFLTQEKTKTFSI